MDELRVDLTAFRGPLDLLLYLVQQEEVDIHEIPIAKIADRFLVACRGQVDNLDVDRAGEFLVMASQLLVLKSRALLPRETPVDIDEVDPRLDLVRQLLEYRNFKQVSSELEARAEAQRLKHGVRVQGPDRKPANLAESPIEVDLYALVAAFQRLLRETGDDTSVHMPKERLPITHFVSQIFDQLTAVGGRLGFRALIGARPERNYVIGAFLALLELMKLRKIRVIQESHEEIQIELAPNAGTLDQPVEETLDAPEVEESVAKGPRIIFMGTPEFAVPALRSLVGAGLRPRLVVTPPPRRAGRGRRMKPAPLAKEAERLELPLHRTKDVNGRTSRNELEAIAPDLIITAGFGQKLGRAILDLPHRGCINIHTSVLPRYRGASPVAAALREGAKETGITLFVMDEAMDEGPIIAQRTMPIDDGDTRDQVIAKLSEVGADLLLRTLPAWLDAEIEPQPQDASLATYVGRLGKNDGQIQWNEPAEVVHNQIRSVTSWPGAQTAWQPRVRHDPMPLLVVKSEVLVPADPGSTVTAQSPATAQSQTAAQSETATPGDTTAATDSKAEGAVTTEVVPGTVVAVSKAGIDVACASGVLRVLRVQPQGKRPMAVKDFLNARRVVVGDRFRTIKGS